MPWTPQSFRSKHNHGLNPAQSEHAAAQANAMLRSGVPEGIAIATANKYANAHPHQAEPKHKAMARLLMKK
jgi:uncharacterized protein YdaT